MPRETFEINEHPLPTKSTQFSLNLSSKFDVVGTALNKQHEPVLIVREMITGVAFAQTFTTIATGERFTDDVGGPHNSTPKRAMLGTFDWNGKLFHVLGERSS